METQKKIYSVYGEGAVTYQTRQKWCVKFLAGDVSLDDAPESGRPVVLDSDQIETLIESHQNSTMWGNSQCTQNIQINKVIGESEKCIFYFTEKN